MQNILVGITEQQEAALNALARLGGQSRAALIRTAIDALLARQDEAAPPAEDGFGLWRDPA